MYGILAWCYNIIYNFQGGCEVKICIFSENLTQRMVKHSILASFTLKTRSKTAI